MISSLCWVPKGAAKAVPEAAPISEEELANMRREAEAAAHDVLDDDASDSDRESEWETDDSEDAEMDDAAAAVAKARAVAASMASTSGRERSTGQPAPTGGIEAALAELDMDHYDSEDLSDDGSEGGGSRSRRAEVVGRALGGKGLGIVLDDPYQQGPAEDEDDDLDSEERDDFVIRPDDLLILAAKNEDEVSTLEVWVYEEPSSSTGGEANLYVHHDLLLPAFPLSLAWMDLHPSGAQGKANLVAVGSIDPGIEIWDLDIVDQVEPVTTLGGLDAAATAAAAAVEAPEGASRKDKKKAKVKAKKKAAKAQPVYLPGSHTDAVLGLSWNAEYRNVLASGSADGTVKVWDVVKGVCEHTLQHHSDKVQAVAWNPAESPVLLTGSFDRTACLVDARAPTAPAAVWKVTADVEALTWDPSQPTSFLVSTEDGMVVRLDARGGAGSAPLFRLSAHDKPTCCLSFCTAAPGLLATASTDKTVKLWNVADNKPSLLATKDAKLGALFAAGFCREVPYLVAMGGAGGSLGVWDVRSCSAVAQAWPELMKDVVQGPAA